MVVSSGAVRQVQDTGELRPLAAAAKTHTHLVPLDSVDRGRGVYSADALPPAVLDSHVKAGSGETGFALYGDTKFIQLLNAHWWRRQLAGRATVVAVSPGLIPNTGISRGFTADGITLPPLGEMKDAKSVSEGTYDLESHVVASTSATACRL